MEMSANHTVGCGSFGSCDFKNGDEDSFGVCLERGLDQMNLGAREIDCSDHSCVWELGRDRSLSIFCINTRPFLSMGVRER